MQSKESLAIKLELLKNRKQLDPNRKLDFVKEREMIEQLYAGLPVPEGCEFRRCNFHGVDAEWITPEKAPTDKTIMYIHGGGFTCFSIDSTRFLVSAIAKSAGLNLISVGYRLAPEYVYPAANEDCLAVYRGLLEEGIPSNGIVIMGESAGGMLMLSTALALKDKGDPLPAAVIAISPLTDMTLEGESHKTKADIDPILAKGEIVQMFEAFAPGEDLKNPYLSPLFGDYNGFPPIMIQAGTDEILLSDSTRLAYRAANAGVDVSLKVWEGMFHGFHSFTGKFPECDDTIRDIGEYICRIMRYRQNV